MKLEYLSEFITIAKLNSFSLASDALYVSQSSLSKHILALEKELGAELFDRSSRQISLTDFGREIIKYAEEILAAREKIEASANKYIADNKISFSLASIPVMAQYRLIELISGFESIYPNIKPNVHEYEGQDIHHLLENKNCELAFQRMLSENRTKYDYLEISYDSLAVILPKHHTQSSKKQICLDALKDENFILLDKQTQIYDFCCGECIKAGFSPNVVYTSSRPENIIEMIKNGRGISLLTKKNVQYYNNPGIVYIDIHPEIPCSIYLTKLKNHKLTDSAQKFWEYAKENNL